MEVVAPLLQVGATDRVARESARATPGSPVMATTKPKALTKATFDDALGEHRVVLVDFWATWCAPCTSMAPDLQQLATEVPDDVLVAKVDVDKQGKLAERFGVQSMPTIMTFVDGEYHSTYVGATPIAGLRAALADADKPKRKGLLRSIFGG